MSKFNREQLYWALVASACLFFTGVADSAESLSRDQLWENLEYASHYMTKTVSASGVRKSMTQPKHPLTEEGLESLVEKHRISLREQIERGDIDTGPYTESLQKDFGVTDLREVLNNPRVRTAIEKHIETKIEQYRRTMIVSRATIEETSEFQIHAASRGRGARIHTKILESDFNGHPNSVALESEKLVSVNGQTFKEFYPQREAGVIMRGEDHNGGLASRQLGNPPLLRAGQPWLTYWSPDDLKGFESEETPEGEAFKVTFDSGDGNMAIMWVLPEKGYRVYREELVVGGGGTRTVATYSQYQEIEPGHWFPMIQQSERYEDGVLVASDQREIETVKPNPELGDEVFDVVFPSGTSVMDLRKGAEHLVQYVVGGQTIEEADQAINEVVKFALASTAETGPVTQGEDAGVSNPSVPVAPVATTGTTNGIQTRSWWVTGGIAVGLLLIAIVLRLGWTRQQKGLKP